jgi:hypothetical protein
MCLDSVVHPIRIKPVLKIAVQGRRVRFNRVNEGRILKRSYVHQQSIAAACVLCIFGAMATGCGDRSRDVTSDPAYGSFSTVTGRWKTKQTLTLIRDESGLGLWTTNMSDHVLGYKTAKAVATLPSGTEVSVERLVLHPSFECDTFTETGSLVSGPYAGQTVARSLSFCPESNQHILHGVPVYQPAPQQLAGESR